MSEQQQKPKFTDEQIDKYREINYNLFKRAQPDLLKMIEEMNTAFQGSPLTAYRFIIVPCKWPLFLAMFQAASDALATKEAAEQAADEALLNKAVLANHDLNTTTESSNDPQSSPPAGE